MKAVLWASSSVVDRWTPRCSYLRVSSAKGVRPGPCSEVPPRIAGPSGSDPTANAALRGAGPELRENSGPPRSIRPDPPDPDGCPTIHKDRHSRKPDLSRQTKRVLAGDRCCLGQIGRGGRRGVWSLVRLPFPQGFVEHHYPRPENRSRCYAEQWNRKADSATCDSSFRGPFSGFGANGGSACFQDLFGHRIAAFLGMGQPFSTLDLISSRSGF